VIRLSEEPTRIERIKCPLCGYAIFGLPAEHACPECGVAYDPYTKVIPLSAPLRLMYVFAAMFALALLGANVIFDWFLQPPLVVGSFLVGLFLIGWIPASLLALLIWGRGRRLVLNQDGIHWYQKKRCRKRIEWPQFQSVRCKRHSGAIEFVTAEDAVIEQVSYREFGTWRRALQCVDEISARIEIYASDSSKQDTR
jgi:hypothetical protein